MTRKRKVFAQNVGGTVQLNTWFDDSSLPRVDAQVKATNVDGWLHVEITAQEQIVGYCISVNGKDIPITVPRDTAEGESDDG